MNILQVTQPHRVTISLLDVLVMRLGTEPNYQDIEQEQLYTANWSLITAPHHVLADLSIKAIVMNSNCVSIISSRLVEVEVAAGRLRLIRLKDVGSLPHVGLVWRRGEKLTPIAARFARITRTIAQRDAESSS